MTQLLRKIVLESEKVWDSTDFKVARTCCESLCYYGASVQNVQLITYDMQVFKRGRLKISTGGGKYKKKCLEQVQKNPHESPSGSIHEFFFVSLRSDRYV